MKNIYKSRTPYSGRMFEWEVFGNPTMDIAHDSTKNSLFESIMEVKKNQGNWDPTDPNTRFANDLHALVADKMGLDDYSDLKFYKALGGGLDHHWGADGFFEVDGKNRVFIDLTLRNKGLRDTVEIHPEDDLDEIATIIAEQLK